MNMMSKHDIFLNGETIDLVISSQAALDEECWHQWLNDPGTPLKLAVWNG